MPIAKRYLDHFYVRNISQSVLGLGDLVNLSIEPGQRVDLLTIPRITKEKINQSYDLQEAIKYGLLQIVKEKCSKRKKLKRERQVIIADTDVTLCDIQNMNLSGVSDDDILQYNASTGKWENKQPTEVDINLNVVSVTNNYTVSIENDLILCDASEGAFVITLPTATGNSGKQMYIKKIDDSNNVVTVDGNSSETVDDELTQPLTGQYDCMDICATSDENWVIT